MAFYLKVSPNDYPTIVGTMINIETGTYFFHNGKLLKNPDKTKFLHHYKGLTYDIRYKSGIITIFDNRHNNYFNVSLFTCVFISMYNNFIQYLKKNSYDLATVFNTTVYNNSGVQSKIDVNNIDLNTIRSMLTYKRDNKIGLNRIRMGHDRYYDNGPILEGDDRYLFRWSIHTSNDHMDSIVGLDHHLHYARIIVDGIDCFNLTHNDRLWRSIMCKDLTLYTKGLLYPDVITLDPYTGTCLEVTKDLYKYMLNNDFDMTSFNKGKPMLKLHDKYEDITDVEKQKTKVSMMRTIDNLEQYAIFYSGSRSSVPYINYTDVRPQRRSNDIHWIRQVRMAHNFDYDSHEKQYRYKSSYSNSVCFITGLPLYDWVYVFDIYMYKIVKKGKKIIYDDSEMRGGIKDIVNKKTKDDVLSTEYIIKDDPHHILISPFAYHYLSSNFVEMFEKLTGTKVMVYKTLVPRSLTDILSVLDISEVKKLILANLDFRFTVVNGIVAVVSSHIDVIGYRDKIPLAVMTGYVAYNAPKRICFFTYK